MSERTARKYHSNHRIASPLSPSLLRLEDANCLVSHLALYSGLSNFRRLLPRLAFQPRLVRALMPFLGNTAPAAAIIPSGSCGCRLRGRGVQVRGPAIDRRWE